MAFHNEEPLQNFGRDLERETFGDVSLQVHVERFSLRYRDAIHVFLQVPFDHC